jgi:hypothetical protein
MSSFFDTSPTMPCASGNSRNTRSTPSRPRATKATRARRFDSSWTSARPSPEVPPVIATRRPANGLRGRSWACTKCGGSFDMDPEYKLKLT